MQTPKDLYDALVAFHKPQDTKKSHSWCDFFGRAGGIWPQLSARQPLASVAAPPRHAACSPHMAPAFKSLRRPNCWPAPSLTKNILFYVKYFLVGLAGFEPTTSSSRTKRATNCATARHTIGTSPCQSRRLEITQVISRSASIPSRSALPVHPCLTSFDSGLPVLAVAGEAVHLLALRATARTQLRYSPIFREDTCFLEKYQSFVYTPCHVALCLIIDLTL